MNPSLQSPVSSLQSNSDVLVRVEGVSKKFCLSLKKSLWYGLQDMGRELTGRRRGGVDGRRQTVDGRLETRDGRLETAAESLQSTVRSPQSNSLGLRPKEFWAVNNVSFELKRGECLGLIGRNGAGKTTLLKMLNGLIKPDAGRIEMRGRVGALIALGAGFNGILTGRENIYTNASVLGLSKKEIDAKLDEIIDFAEIGDFIDTPVQNYSSGMAVRLGFAVASSLEPDILLLDEVLAVGDAEFRAKCYHRISQLRNRAAVVFVSHSMEQIAQVCDTGMVLQKGICVFHGEVPGAIDAYSSLGGHAPTGELESTLVTSPKISHADISCTTEVDCGGTIYVNLNFTTVQGLGPVKCRISLWDSRGSVVADYFAIGEQEVEIGPGTHSIQCRIDDLALKGGTYRYAVGVLDKTGAQIFWSLRQIALLVHGPSLGLSAYVAKGQIVHTAFNSFPATPTGRF